MKKIFLCAISNINSGTCKEDCKFCSQSIRYKAKIQRYAQKSINIIIGEAKLAKKAGALGFCLVTAHKSLDDKTLEFVCKTAKQIKSTIPSLRLIACNGTASLEQLKELKEAGISAYNHNLETSQEFYPKICTTHSWEQRYETCENINASGLVLISGGIFGLGEEKVDRISMLNSLNKLNPTSVPINFYHHNVALPLQSNNLTINDALSLITLTKQMVKNTKRIMVAGGREIIFKNRQSEIFNAGANAIVIGDYLTTKGANRDKDLQMIHSLGYSIASSI